MAGLILMAGSKQLVSTHYAIAIVNTFAASAADPIQYICM